MARWWAVLLMQFLVVESQNSYDDSYLGCYWDRGSRDLSKYYGWRYNIKGCRKKAAQGNYKYFGLQVNGQCFAGNKYGKYGTPGNDWYCKKGNYKTRDTNSERMLVYGNDWRNAIYFTKESTFTLAKKNDMFRNDTFLGCYWDNGDREYDDTFIDPKDKKKKFTTSVSGPDECAAVAKANKKNFFALQVGHQCFVSSNMFNDYWNYPPTMRINDCASHKVKKASKFYANYGGGAWRNALYTVKPSAYYPALYWDSPGADSTVRLAWANAYCLNVQGGKYVKGAKIIAYHCVDNKGKVSGNMKFKVEGGLMKVKDSPSWCVTTTKLSNGNQLSLLKCGTKKVFQKIQLYGDMTIRFTDKMEFGFNVWGGIGGGNGLNNRRIAVYKVMADNNEAFIFRNAAPPTPRPTPVPTPSPPLTGLKKAKGWSIKKGKCTIDITSGVPCAVSSNYPKTYADEDSCEVKMTKTEAVEPEKFVTEQYFDIVTIGANKLSGKPGKKKIALAKGVDTIKWSSDFYLGGTGWKICKTKKGSPKILKLAKKKGGKEPKKKVLRNGKKR